MKKRGFITIATGSETYYKLAYNLLLSYKFHTKHPLPWAIICDKENDVTRSFDEVIILDTPTRSYMDKIEMLLMVPFEENIFIDADSLCYDDINNFFDYFPFKGVKCFGSTFPLSDKIHGWYSIDDIGEWGNKVDSVINMHGGNNLY